MRNKERGLNIGMRAGLAIGLTAVAAVIAGCGKEPPAKTEAAALPPVPVQTVEVRMMDWPATYEAVGTVKARNSAQVASRVMGYVREMKVNAGDRVSAGQLLASIDARDLESGVQQASAGVVEAQSAIPEADNAIAAAKANLELTQVTYKRMKDLFDERSISNQEFDEMTSKVKLAQANYEMAVARRKQLDAKIQQAESARRTAEITHGYSEIRAPFAGVVTEKRANAGDMAAPGTPLLIIEQAGAYQLEVPVEEVKLGVVRAGQPVSVKLDAFEKAIPAKVTEVIPAIDSATRSFLVKIVLPPDPRLHSGLFGRAGFVLGARKAVAVPRAAVAEIGQIRNVLVADGGVAHARMLSLGETHDDLVEVLSGVSARRPRHQPPPGECVRRLQDRGAPVSLNHETQAEPDRATWIEEPPKHGAPPLGIAGKMARAWIDSKLTPLFIGASLLIGAFSVWMLPREEEPQIIVPMIDVFVGMPGSSAREVEERVTKPMEKLLWEIPGVEYVYSTSRPGSSMAIVRFKVGEDEEKSIVRLNQKLYANFDIIPAGATPPLVKPRSIDDVPILALTLDQPALRRLPAAPARRAGARHHQAGGQCLGGDADRRPAARGAGHARRGAARRLQPVTRAGGGRHRGVEPADSLGLLRRRQPRPRTRDRRISQDGRRRPQRRDRRLQRQAHLPSRRRPGFGHRRRAHAVRAVFERQILPARRHHRGLETQGRQCHRGGRSRSRSESRSSRAPSFPPTSRSRSRATTARRPPKSRTNCCSTWPSRWSRSAC